MTTENLVLLGQHIELTVRSGAPGPAGAGATKTTAAFVIAAVGDTQQIAVLDPRAFPKGLQVIVAAPDSSEIMTGFVTVGLVNPITVQTSAITEGNAGDSMPVNSVLSFSGGAGAQPVEAYSVVGNPNDSSAIPSAMRNVLLGDPVAVDALLSHFSATEQEIFFGVAYDASHPAPGGNTANYVAYNVNDPAATLALALGTDFGNGGFIELATIGSNGALNGETLGIFGTDAAGGSVEIIAQGSGAAGANSAVAIGRQNGVHNPFVYIRSWPAHYTGLFYEGGDAGVPFYLVSNDNMLGVEMTKAGQFALTPFTSLPATKVNGAIEFDGTNYYGTAAGQRTILGTPVVEAYSLFGNNTDTAIQPEAIRQVVLGPIDAVSEFLSFNGANFDQMLHLTAYNAANPLPDNHEGFSGTSVNDPAAILQHFLYSDFDTGSNLLVGGWHSTGVVGSAGTENGHVFAEWGTDAADNAGAFLVDVHGSGAGSGTAGAMWQLGQLEGGNTGTGAYMYGAAYTGSYVGFGFGNGGDSDVTFQIFPDAGEYGGVFMNVDGQFGLFAYPNAMSLPATPVNGALEFDSSRFYGTAGGVRSAFAQVGNANVFTKPQTVTPYRANISGAVTIDLSRSNNQHLTIVAPVTGLTFINPPDGVVCTIRFYQDSAGGHSMPALPSSFKFSNGAVPTWSSAPNAWDMLSFQYGSNEGTYGAVFNASMS